MSNGRDTSVTVTDAEGHRLAGKVTADGRSWLSDRKAVPGAAYTVRAWSRPVTQDRIGSGRVTHPPKAHEPVDTVLA